MGKLEYEGFVTSWLRACIGIAMLLLAAAPFLLALGKSLQWMRG